MKMTIDMPMVGECTVDDCAYNLDRRCHARAITVGDGVHPGCDTYFSNTMHTSARGRNAGVGACKVTACAHNDDFECMAEGIRVGMRNGMVDCLTFTSG